MFQELKELLAAQNVKKIRQTQRELDRSSDYDDIGEDSWISYDDQLSERIEVFKTLMDQNSRNRNPRLTQQAILSGNETRWKKQKQLLEEKLVIERQNHERQMEYLKEKQQRQLRTLKTQIEKYQYREKKINKEQGVLLTLRKENRQLIELQSQSSENIQRIMNENTNLKKQIIDLKALVKQKEELQALWKADHQSQSSNEKHLKQKIDNLMEQKNMEADRRKQLQVTISRLRLEVEDLSREVDRVKMERTHEKIEESQKWKLEMVKIQQQNLELKKRNQKLESSFIEHLTQTSLNLQQSIKNQPDRSAKNTTLYLQETPIKSRSRERQYKSPEEQDPQKSQCEVKKCDCLNQMAKLKIKLRQANSKIVELLQQKCQSHRLK